MRILVVEDDDLLGGFIAKCLQNHGFLVDVVCDGKIGYRKAQKGGYDGIILDINLPTMIGTEVCKKLREESVVTPILFLSAYSSKDDRVKGLDLGADDYLVKPFSHEELIARTKAILRRPSAYIESTVSYAELTIDTTRRSVFVSGELVRLTPKEFELLELFIRHPEIVLSREFLLKHIWGVTIGNTSNRLEVCVRALRKKLDSIEDGIIHTEYGVGYRLFRKS